MQQPPYPSTTKAGGFKFELDCDRISQSDTWALATPHLRPLLLMLWFIAWQQTPCGSLPASDVLIAARLGLRLDEFQPAKSIFLRGWTEASDGRLYHPTLTELVLGMIGRKARETQRKADYRQRQREGTLSHGTNAGQSRDGHGNALEDTRDSNGNDDTTTTTTTTTITTTINESIPDGIDSVKTRKTTGALSLSDLVAEGVDKQHAEDWLTVRKVRRAPLTRAAWDDVKTEATKAGVTPAEAVRIAATRSWQGFQASWLETNGKKTSSSNAPSSRHSGFDQRDYGTGGRF